MLSGSLELCRAAMWKCRTFVSESVKDFVLAR